MSSDNFRSGGSPNKPQTSDSRCVPSAVPTGDTSKTEVQGFLFYFIPANLDRIIHGHTFIQYIRQITQQLLVFGTTLGEFIHSRQNIAKMKGTGENSPEFYFSS